MLFSFICDGFFVGSTTIKIDCTGASDGLPVWLYRGINTLLGTGTTTDGYCTIALTSALQASDENLIAYVQTDRCNTGGPQRIISNVRQNMTSWKKPKVLFIQAGIVDTPIDYDTYLSSGKREYPDLYDPERLRNTTPQERELINGFFAKIYASLSFESVPGSTVVKIEIVGNTKKQGGYTIQFDSGAIGSVSIKTYNVSGTYSVKIVDTINSSNAITIPFTVNIIPASVSPVTAISQLWCDFASDPNQPELGVTAPVYCFSSVPVQFKIDGMNGNNWVDGVQQPNHRHYNTSFVNAPVGVRTLRCREKANTANEKTVTFTIY